MTKNDFIKLQEEIGKEAPIVVSTVDGQKYKGIFDGEINDEGIFYLKEITPYGSLFAIAYEDVKLVEEDKNSTEYEYIEGLFRE